MIISGITMGGGTPGTFLTMQTGDIIKNPPVNTVAPVVSGTASFGSTLSTTDGTWTNTPTISYKWQRNGVDISGATSSTYTLVAADVGNPIRCVVTGTNGDGSSSAISNATANVVATVPGAPTIGTATTINDVSANVTFTAPASNGGSTILSYTATSSPGGITGTLSQAGSGTITITGLTASTSYTFTITATNSVGTSSASSASNSITTDVPDISVKKAIFGYGSTGNYTSTVSITNIVSSTGVVATDTTGVGTTRGALAAAGYGGDKAIFGYGQGSSPSYTYLSMTNKVSNAGVVATDTTGVGTIRYQLAAATYGTDKAIFGYGAVQNMSTLVITYYSLTNLVSNTGTVATDTAGVGTARRGPAAAGYGGDKAIFGYGTTSSTVTAITNLVSSTGVVASNTTGVGTARAGPSAATYGTDKAIFGYGQGGSPSYSYLSMTNLVSNTGVVATDTTGVGTARYGSAAAGYGGNKAIFGYGDSGFGPAWVSITNLVSNTGVVATDTTGVGTARGAIAAASFSISA
jgi:hypothetical protein